MSLGSGDDQCFDFTLLQSQYMIMCFGTLRLWEAAPIFQLSTPIIGTLSNLFRPDA